MCLEIYIREVTMFDLRRLLCVFRLEKEDDIQKEKKNWREGINIETVGIVRIAGQ